MSAETPGSKQLRPEAERTDRRRAAPKAGLQSRRGLDAASEGVQRDKIGEFMKQLLQTIRRDGEKPAFKYNASKPALMDVNKIMSLLPHRYPFLLVDKVFHIDDNSIGAIKNISINEPFFCGHFPTEPVMPGVLLVEAMAQAGGLFVLNGVEHPEEYSTYFLKIDSVRFKRKVVPGDTLQLEVYMVEPLRRGIATMLGKVFVAGQLACEATLMAQVIKNKN